ncbi:MAG: hypothetical protein WCE45_01350 [Sedimentisphaerales bacterium]
MKKTIFIFAVLFFSFVSAQTYDPNTLQELRNAVSQLNLQITNLLKIIESQQAELARLRKLCSDAGIDTTPPAQEQTSQEVVEINQPLFGVYLGETLDALRSRLKVSKGKYVLADKDCPGKVWSVKNSDPNIKRLLVCSFNERIYEVDVEFRDSDMASCRAIKSQLEKSYQPVGWNKYNRLFGKSVFETVIDDVNIGIQVNCNIGAGKNDTITLTYIHVPILKEMLAEQEKRKPVK